MATKSFIKTIGSKGLLSDYNTAGKKLQTELIAGDRVTINGSTITADNQIFYAVYGSSTYAEVRAAHDAGKAVFCFNENGMYYLRSVNNSLIAFVRCQVVDSLPNINELYLNNNNEWKKGSNIVCQKRLTFDTTPTAGSTNPVTSDGIKTALNDKFDKYGFFGKTDGKWIGAALSVDSETEVKYWKLCSFTTAKFWSLNFVADVTNAHYDSNVFERKIIEIYGFNPGVVSSALEIR